ncbi:TMEM175 family protein [Brevundimonas fluminis]|jgi:uncharacterized membrane protein|uniref:TMEM175 family protein n=1 Tax=Brevundimonas fluminis TaxID=2487274 RepID=UPI000F656E89|nr:TMEM175 family protein [Brevundimonas fluminis]
MDHSDAVEREAGKRLDAFVDAAFAFAVTLLIIAGAEPLTGFADLGRALAHVPAFAAGFALVTMFWSAHRGFGRLTTARGGAIGLISLAIVFTVLVYVFPLRLLTESGMGWISGGRLPGGELIRSIGDLRGIFVSYGIGFAFLSGLYALLNHVGRPQARDPAARAALGAARDVWLMCVGAGLVSAGLAASPLLAAAPWAPGFAYWLIPAGIGLYYGLKRKPAAGPDPAA